MMRALLRAALARVGLKRARGPGLGSASDLYRPRYSPWLDTQGFGRVYAQIQPFTLVDSARCFVLHSLARQARHLAGEYWECGVYRGGTALLLGMVAEEVGRPLRLFDTFEGMPPADPQRDWHAAGDFSDTSEESVRRLVRYPHAFVHKGRIPATFEGLESSVIALAHIDVDLYQSVLDCCSFIYPRLPASGFMLFDDYGWPTCVGARQAVDRFFADKPEVPLVLTTGQALVVRLPGNKAPSRACQEPE
jgi:O-methyltransferase